MSNKFKFRSIVFLGINGILGAGIFATPSKAFAQLGFNSLYVILLCAVLAIIMALCFAEMGGKFTETGGPYVYVKNTYGDFWGFQIGFIRLIVGCIAWSAVMVAIPETQLSVYYPWFKTYVGKTVTSLVLVSIISIINLRGVKSSELFNNILTILKLSPLVIFIITGLFFINKDTLHTAIESTPKLTLSQLSSGFLLLVYSFYGFENIGVAAQDMENPTKNIPKAIFTTMVILTIVYFLIYLVLIGTLGNSLAPNGHPINAPIAVSMASYMGSWVTPIIIATATISMFGFSLASGFAAAKNVVPLSRDHFLPENLGADNSRGVPQQAIILVMIIAVSIPAIAGLLSKDAFSLLVIVGGIGRFLQYIPVTLAVLKSRKLGIPGTFKLVFANLLVPVAVFISIICIIFTNTKDFSRLTVFSSVGAIILLSLCTYIFYAKPRANKTIKQ